MPWPVTYYRTRDGAEPAREYIDSLDARTRAACQNYIERLAIFGPHLPFPSSSQVDGELRELRPDMGNLHYRLLYRRSDNIFVIVHAFLKPGKRIDPAEIAIAQTRWEDLIERMNADPRRPPRPIGHDAT
jgi:phage-related protein